MPRSVMEHSFSNVPRVNIPRSSFNRSHGHKTTFDADYLIPILVDDIIPGDTFNVNCSFVARLATPLYPIMDNLYLETFFFFVPYRLLWDNWEKFCGAQDDPGDSISFTVPVLSGASTQTGESRLWIICIWRRSFSLCRTDCCGITGKSFVERRTIPEIRFHLPCRF